MQVSARSIRDELAASFYRTDVAQVVAKAKVKTTRDGYTVTLPEPRPDIIARINRLITPALEREWGTGTWSTRAASPRTLVVAIRDAR